MSEPLDKILDQLVQELYSKPYDKAWAREVIKKMARVRETGKLEA